MNNFATKSSHLGTWRCFAHHFDGSQLFQPLTCCRFAGPDGTMLKVALQNIHLPAKPRLPAMIRWQFQVFPCMGPRRDPRKAQHEGEGVSV